MANFVLGAGKIYLDRLSGSDYTGEVLLAESPSVEYSVTSTRAQEFTSDGPLAEMAADVLTGVTREGSFTLKDISDYNLALHVIGAVTSITTSVASKTGTAVNGGKALVADRWYQIGLTDYPHVGVRDITSVTLSTGETDYTVDTQYTIDLALGRFYVPVGSPMVGAIVTADYSTTASTWTQVASSDSAIAEGRLRFVSDNTTGTNRDYLFPSVVLMPDGANALKSREKFQELKFKFSIKKPATGSAVYINGRPT